MKIHHIGYFVTSIENSAAQFQQLGFKVASPCIFDEDRKVFIQFLNNADNSAGHAS